MRFTEWMKHTALNAWYACATILSVSVAYLFVHLLWTVDNSVNAVRKEAVQHGVARWYARPDGSVEFQWAYLRETPTFVHDESKDTDHAR